MDVKNLYKMIPKFECIKGCNECCGPVPIIQQEAKNLNLKTCMLPFAHKSLNCKYSSKQGCTIYEKRPLLCRLFGVVQKMACPYGGKPEKLLSQEQENQILKIYHSI